MTTLFAVDFGKMRKSEIAAMKGEGTYTSTESEDVSKYPGKDIDLLLPVIALIILSIVSMLYTGGCSAEKLQVLERPLRIVMLSQD